MITDDNKPNANQNANAAQQPNAGQRQQAPSINAIHSTWQRGTHIGPDGENYCKFVADKLNNAGLNVKLDYVHTDIADVAGFTKEGKTFLIIFDYTNNTGVPTPKQFATIITDAANKLGTAVINYVNVITEDFARSAQMADVIENEFRLIELGNAPLTDIGSYHGVKLTLECNVNRVREFIDRMNPHSIQPRIDYGFILQAEELRGQQVVTRPLVALGGYTRVADPAAPTQPSQGLIAMANITAVASSVPDRNMATVALPIACELFINQQYWLAPYATFSKNAPNLGSLFLDDATKKPLRVTTQQALNQLAFEKFKHPILAMDIPEGYYTIPGLRQFAHDFAGATNSVATFVRSPEPLPICSDRAFSEIIGATDGNTKDSRCSDYLNLVHKGIDRAAIQDILRMYDADHTGNVLGNWVDYKPLYGVNRVPFSAAFVARLATHVSSLTVNTHGGQCNQASGLVAIADGYSMANAPYFQQGGGGVAMNPLRR